MRSQKFFQRRRNSRAGLLAIEDEPVENVEINCVRKIIQDDFFDKAREK